MKNELDRSKPLSNGDCQASKRNLPPQLAEGQHLTFLRNGCLVKQPGGSNGLHHVPSAWIPARIALECWNLISARGTRPKEQ
jgi:hypothetical protein